MSKKKIGFLFLTVQDVVCPKVWKAFFRHEVYGERYYITAHCKYPSRIEKDAFLFPFLTQHHEKTQWGGIGLVKATIVMLEETLSKDPEIFHFILLSETSIPVISFDELYENLQKETMSCIDTSPSFYPRADTEQRYHRFMGKDHIALKDFQKAHQWIMLNRKDAEFFAEWPMVREFSRMFAPDEHYFVNVMNHHRRPFRNKGRTFVDFELFESHPKYYHVLTKSFIEFLRKHGYYFLRKVGPDTKLIL